MTKTYTTSRTTGDTWAALVLLMHDDVIKWKHFPRYWRNNIDSNNTKTSLRVDNSINKQRVLMHRHQGRNVRHGLCHIYMRYLHIYELFIAFVCFVVCSLL